MDRSEMLGEVWAREFGVSPVGFPSLGLAAVGWSPADVRWLAGLAAQALYFETGVARLARRDVGLSSRSPREAAASRLGVLGTALIRSGGLTRQQSFGWLAAVTGAPEIAGVHEVEQMAYATIGCGAESPVRLWPAEVGPWAWAAGFSLTEAQAGTLTVDGYRALAALRGHALLPSRAT